LVVSAAIEVAEVVLPGSSPAEAAEAASAFRRELFRLWRADRVAGLGWRTELPGLSFEADPQLGARGLGEAMAREVRRHALDGGGAP
jgi:hypothetical protein